MPSVADIAGRMGALAGVVRQTAADLAGTAMRAYDAAARNYLTSSLPSTNTGPNVEVGESIEPLRALSADQMRNNPIAIRVRNATVARMIGHGHTPECDSDEWMKVWEEWRVNCYLHDRRTFEGVQELVERTKFDAGGCLVQRVWVDDPDLPLPMMLRVIEPDQIDRWKDGDTSDGGYIVQGRQFDRYGRPTGVWILDEHPGETTRLGRRLDSQFVSWKDLAYRFHEDRPGQVHAAPEITPVARALHAVERYISHEIVRKQRESSVVGVVVGGDDSEDDTDTDNRTAKAVTNARGQIVESWSPGQLLYAPAGREITFNQPAAIGGFREFITQILHWVAAGKSLPYFSVSGDLSQVNYSSARIGDVEARAWVRPTQINELDPQFLAVVARWVTEAAIVKGRLRGRVSDFVVRWQPPAVEEHNREEAAKADALEERFGYASHSEQVRKRGKNPKRLQAQQKADLESQAADGLVFDTNAKLTGSWLSTTERKEAEVKAEQAAK